MLDPNVEAQVDSLMEPGNEAKLEEALQDNFIEETSPADDFPAETKEDATTPIEKENETPAPEAEDVPSQEEKESQTKNDKTNRVKDILKDRNEIAEKNAEQDSELMAIKAENERLKAELGKKKDEGESDDSASTLR